MRKALLFACGRRASSRVGARSYSCKADASSWQNMWLLFVEQCVGVVIFECDDVDLMLVVILNVDAAFVLSKDRGYRLNNNTDNEVQITHSTNEISGNFVFIHQTTGSFCKYCKTIGNSILTISYKK